MGRRLPREALFLPGLERAPCHAIYHSFLKALDIAATEQALSAWVRSEVAVGQAAGHVARDGEQAGVIDRPRRHHDVADIERVVEKVRSGT